MTAEFGAMGRVELVLVSAADDEALVAEISRLAAFLFRINHTDSLIPLVLLGKLTAHLCQSLGRGNTDADGDVRP